MNIHQKNAEYWIRCFRSADFSEDLFLKLKVIPEHLGSIQDLDNGVGSISLHFLADNALGAELQRRKEDPQAALETCSW